MSFMKLFRTKFTTILLGLSFLIGAIFTLNFALKTNAAELNAGVLKITYDGAGPLFSETNIAPGYEMVKTVTVSNTGSVPHSFSIAVSGTLGSLADVLQIEPRIAGTATPYWNKTISQIAKSPNSNVILGSIAPGETAMVDIAAILPESVGNDFQDTTTLAFSFVVGNESTDQPEPYYSPIVTPIFGTSRKTLASNIFRPGEPVQTPETLTANQPKEDGIVAEQTETKGEETSSKNICFWWWVLSIVYALFLIIYGWLTYKKEIIFNWIAPVLGGVFLYFLHWYLHRFYTPSKWCPYFIWFELALLIIYFILFSYFKNRAQSEKNNR